MLSKRDKLLIRPWQERRFENHRRKVQSALPAIDASPPKSREHVLYKRKKQQNETERSVQIEKENLLLLRRMGYIMRTNRVDNFWATPPPNFLNRVNLYEYKIIAKEIQDKKSSQESILNAPITRKTKCIACTPQEFKTIEIPEERIPWDPPKPTLSRRLRSKSLPPRPPPSHQPPALETAPKPLNKPKRTTTERSRSSRRRTDGQPPSDNVHCLVLSRGALKLYVNFPPDTSVKMQDGIVERVISRGLCRCKNATTATTTNKRFS